MKLDRFTKAMLVVIAILLGLLVFRPVVQPARCERKQTMVTRSTSSRATP